ncbi:hypothetical protein WA171_003607 [Blastocystis sp. BT1]
MARFFRFSDLKAASEKYVHPYIRYFNFYLVVVCLALFLRWLGLRYLIISLFVSYCTLKYIFSIIRKVDTYFHTNVTSVIEDNTVFYEGSFIADLQSALNIIVTLLLPHFSSILNLPLPQLLTGIIDAVKIQKPIEYHGKLLDLNSSLPQEIKHYSKMIVGAYGKKFNLKQDINPSTEVLSKVNLNELSSVLDIQMGDEAYVEFLLQHSNLEVDDLLYCCFEGDTLKAKSGVEFHSPPLFILRDSSTKSIVVLIRGTQNLNDIVIDIYGTNMKWEEGYVHEGMGMIAKWIATDNLIMTTLQEALDSHPDYTLKVVGHSLGAGIAALTAIYWKNHKTFRRYEKTTKNRLFMRCFAYAPPPVLSQEIKEKGVGYVYSIVNEDDIVPRLNVKCIYEALNEIQSCVKETDTKHDPTLTSEKRHLRESLRHISHVREDSKDEDNGVSIRVSSTWSSQYNTISTKTKEIEKMFKQKKSRTGKPVSSIYGDFVLPGSIYLLHPYIGNKESYQQYETAKSSLISSWKTVSKLFAENIISPAPGIMCFKSEEQFPQIMRLSPYLCSHHNFRVYEKSIDRILSNNEIIVPPK